MNDRGTEQIRLAGRGTAARPANRFEATRLVEDVEQLEHQAGSEESAFRKLPTQFLPDRSKSIITKNDSPDIPFRYSINPYRGCEHGCSYCYARPGHEYLGMNAGIEFESKILVKHEAARLLRDELCRPSWEGEMIALSGVTDCYQPAERRFRLTQQILEVMLEARQPVGIVTKNALVLRDLDLLVPLAKRRLVHVFVSITTLDGNLAKRMEPRTASPNARLRTISELNKAGVPVAAMVAPVIPGLNDEEIARVLEAVAEAGAITANYILLRLPWAVEPVFRGWLRQHVPLKKDRIESLIRATRGGKLSDAAFGRRMRGKGTYASLLDRSFRICKQKFGLERAMPELDRSQFRPPRDSAGQARLF